MKEFFSYFFGQGESVEFTAFSLAHFIPIIVGIALILLIYRFRDQIREGRAETAFRYFLGFALIVSEMSYFWRLVGVPSLGANPIDHLPITVCGWASVFCSFMVIGKSQSLFDISYFWIFSGTVFALITPTVITYTGPTRFRYYQFWIQHIFVYVATFYMIYVHGMRPRVKSIIKSYSALLVLTFIAYHANRMLGPGANYLFMAAPEDTPSILDILPPNFALRFIVMMTVITAMFLLAYLPWFIKDRKAKAVAKDKNEP